MKRCSLLLLLVACGATKTASSGAAATTAPPGTATTTPVTKTPAVTAPATTTTATPPTTIVGHKQDPAAALTSESTALCSHATTGKRCNSLARLNVDNQVFMGANPQGLAPADLYNVYNLDVSTDPGVTVAVVDAFDAPYIESDLGTYRAQYGMKACTYANGCLRKFNQDGQDLNDQASSQPVPDAGWAGEATLDVEMVSAGCPKCKILLVEAYSDADEGLNIANATAAALGATVISNSWGGPEYPQEVQDDEAYFHHPGVTTFVSSGDEGYVAEYPASSQYVIAVGGTNVGLDENGDIVEVAWGGASSGCSAYEDKPSYQTDTACPNRMEADLSAVADPYTGVAVFFNFPYPTDPKDPTKGTTDAGGWSVLGGTSVASPLVAAMWAQTGHAGDDASVIYANPSAFYDVTEGSNGECNNIYMCNAIPGYDGPTGVGSPNGAALVAIPAQSANGP